MNNFHIYDPIGRGGAERSVVYKGRKKRTVSYVAIKRTSRDNKATVLREVKLLHSISHPNILKFHAWYETSKHLWIILEYCVGGDLASLLRADGRLPAAAAAGLARDLAAGLLHLHAAGTLHRDLVPSNVLLDEAGRARLCGFAHSHPVSEAGAQPRGPRAAPELAHPAAPPSTASDLWSLGALVYECVQGGPPPPPPPSGSGGAPCPPGVGGPELGSLLQRLLDPDPGSRAGWAEVCAHPVWGAAPLPLPALPQEPELEAFLRQPRSVEARRGSDGGGGGAAAPAERDDAERGAECGADATPAHPSTRARHLGGLAGEGARRLEFGGEGPDGGGASAPGAAPDPLAALLWHPSDTALKPIVGNRRIQALPEPGFIRIHLPFAPWSGEALVAAPPEELAAYLDQVCAVLAAPPARCQLAALGHVAGVASHPGAANALVSSEMAVSLLVAVQDGAGGRGDGGVAARAAHLLGLLVRHASVVGAGLGRARALEVLAAGARAADPELARRSAAALGEMLFYISAQPPAAAAAAAAGGGGRRAAAAWAVPPEVLACVLGLLRPGVDPTVRHYAAKTVENVVSQPSALAADICGAATATALAQMVESADDGDAARGAAAGALCCVLRARPELLDGVLNGPVESASMLADGLGDASARVQQAAITMLCMLLLRPGTAAAAAAAALEPAFLAGIVALLSSPVSAVRGKALLALTLLSRRSAAALAALCTASTLQHAERAAAQGDPYVTAAYAALRRSMATAAAATLQQAVEQVREGRQLEEVMEARVPALLALLGSSALQDGVVTGATVVQLADLLDASGGAHLRAWPRREQLKADALAAVDLVVGRPEMLAAHHGEVLGSLVPALAAQVGSADATVDVRFMAWKLQCDVLLQLLAEPRLFAARPPAGTPLAASSAAVDGAVVAHTLPLLPALFEDEDPLPRYALKMLSVLLATNPGWMGEVAELGLAARFFAWLHVDHPHNNVHNIRMCTLAVRSAALGAGALGALGAGARALGVLRYAAHNGVEPFLEPALELCLALLQAGACTADLLGGGAPVFVALSCHPAGATSAAAARCLAALARAEPAAVAAALASEQSIGAVAAALEDAVAPGKGETCAVLVHTLSAAWGLPDALDAAGLSWLVPRLQTALEAVVQHAGAAEVRQEASRVAARLQQ